MTHRKASELIPHAATLVGFGLLAVIVVELAAQRAALARSTAPVSEVMKLGVTAHSDPNVLFVFRAGDCPAALDVIDQLKAATRSGNLRVTGLLLAEAGSDTIQLREVAQSYGVVFPLRISTSPDVPNRLATLGIVSLPVSLVFDAKGQLRAVTPSAYLVGDSLVRRAIAASFNAGN